MASTSADSGPASDARRFGVFQTEFGASFCEVVSSVSNGDGTVDSVVTVPP